MGVVVSGMLTLALISFPSIDLSLLRDSSILTLEIVKNVDLIRNIVWKMLDGDIDNSYIIVVMTGAIIAMAKGNKPYKGENGKDFAKRLMDEKYGKDNWKKGQDSEYNRIQKWGDRGFE